MAGCAYGETYEPDPPDGVELAAGWENVARPITIGVGFPSPEFGRAGDRFDVRIAAVGKTAVDHLDAVWDALRIAGADVAIGLGEDHIPFDVERTGPATDHTVDLPASADTGGRVTVRVTLTGPLFLSERIPDGGGSGQCGSRRSVNSCELGFAPSARCIGCTVKPYQTSASQR